MLVFDYENGDALINDINFSFKLPMQISKVTSSLHIYSKLTFNLKELVGI